MWVRSSAPLSENIAQVSTPVSSHFLVLGDQAALIDSSVAAMADRLITSITPYHDGDFPLRYILLTHSHFDHVGGVPALRKAFPNVQIIASPLTAELLSSEDHVQQIYDRNLACAAALSSPMLMSFEDFKAGLKISKIMSEGDSLSLGDGVEIKVVSCPGHTPDTTGYYIKKSGAFAGAESIGGYSGREKITPCFLSSRQDYTQSLDKILTLDIRYLSLPHGGALTGELAKRFLSSARDEADRFVEAARAALETGVIREELSLDLVGEWTAQGISPEGPFTVVQEEVATRMIELALKEIEPLPVED